MAVKRKGQLTQKEGRILLPERWKLKKRAFKLHRAVKEGNYERTKKLIASVDVNAKNEKGQTPLEISLKNNRRKITKLLLNNGASLPNAQKKQNTKLHLAARSGKPERVKKLLNQFDVDVNNRSGQTPLHLAIAAGNPGIVGVLLRRGADPNATFQREFTISPLMLAAFNDHISIVKKLVKNGADVNFNPPGAGPPLHLAVVNENPQMVKFLVRHGAKINVVDSDGRTALDLARMKGNDEIQEYLEGR